MIDRNQPSTQGIAYPSNEPHSSAFTIFLIFLRLGLTSFGGPVAHLAFFRDEFVTRKKWLSEQAYAELVSLCQFLPGPASSQVGMALGLGRGGFVGSVAAWLGFTLPSAGALVIFALGVAKFNETIGVGWLHGLKVVAVAVVAQALWAMGKALCPDRVRASFAVVATIIVLLIPPAVGQVVAIFCGAIFGRLLLHKHGDVPHNLLPMRLSRTAGAIALILFLSLLVGLPLVANLTRIPGLEQFAFFYRAGALVFGGGHVVLPLLQAEVIPRGWVSNDAFLAGYGAAQAIPGPLFAFAAFLGAISTVEPSSWLGGALCLVAIFMPAFLLITGVLPFWEQLRRFKGMQSSMQGINAAVVGLLLAAFYNPVWTSGIHGSRDFALAATDLVLITFWKLPPWLVVVFSAVAGALVF